jgi:hypothetical protein
VTESGRGLAATKKNGFLQGREAVFAFVRIPDFQVFSTLISGSSTKIKKVKNPSFHSFGL